MASFRWIPISDFRGGQNSTDAPLDLAETQVVLARNGETFRTKMFKKRNGSTAPAIGTVFAGDIISSLIAHYPDNKPANAELWGADDDAGGPHLGRMAGATTFTAVTLTDLIPAGSGAIVRGASFNGKLFLVYGSNGSADAVHVWDPNMAVPRVRKVGLPLWNPPTVANSVAGGTYAAVVRYYRTRYRIKHSTIVDAQSEPSSSVAFTPDAAHTGAVITQPVAPGLSETHWVVEGSADNVTFYELAEIVIATTTYTDTAPVTGYAFNTLSPVLGAFAQPGDASYVLAAFNRVFWAGSHYTANTHLKSRVFFTPAKGTSDKADDERVPNTLTVRNWVDLDEGIGGDVTGLVGPVYGSIYVFKYARIKQMTPTGSSSPVFDVVEISATRGALEQECICVGEDHKGRQAVYFMDSQVGPMMLSSAGAVPIGDGIRDQWDSVNLAATTKVGQVVDYPAKDQVWFWFATGASNDPNVCAKYTKRTGAWDVDDTGGQLRKARCAVLFPRVLGASMSRDKVPYVGYTGLANTLLRADTSDLNDNGTPFQTLVKTRPYVFNGGQRFRIVTPWLVAKAATGVSLTITADGDFGRDVRTSQTPIDLTPTAAELASGTPTRVFRKCEGLDLDGVRAVQFQIGDAAEASNGWQIETLWVPVEALADDP